MVFKNAHSAFPTCCTSSFLLMVESDKWCPPIYTFMESSYYRTMTNHNPSNYTYTVGKGKVETCYCIYGYFKKGSQIWAQFILLSNSPHAFIYELWGLVPTQQLTKTNIKANVPQCPLSSFQLSERQKMAGEFYTCCRQLALTTTVLYHFSIDFNRLILDMGLCFMPTTEQHRHV